MFLSPGGAGTKGKIGREAVSELLLSEQSAAANKPELWVCSASFIFNCATPAASGVVHQTCGLKGVEQIWPYACS